MGEKREQAVARAEAALPDFRNIGVVLRIVVLAELARVIVGLVVGDPGHARSWANPFAKAAIYEPALLTTLLVLILLNPLLARLRYQAGCLVVAGVALLCGLCWNALYPAHIDGGMDVYDVLRVAIVSAAVSALVLFYFNWRYRVLSPALSEARLFALQARIRPHFLFNSLNTVLGLIRADPKQAETVLENLSELFRALMAESHILVPLAREVALARAYLEVEAVRLGDRLTVNWQYPDGLNDALVPPLMLQPLLENAVYHGIEPAEAGGQITVTIFAKNKQLHLVVRNPVSPGRERRRPGNRMALNNIQERLDLHFDADASMRYYEAGDEFVVQIRMPYRHGQPA